MKVYAVIQDIKKTPLLVALGFAFCAIVSSFMIASSASAAPLQQVLVRFDRMEASQDTTMLVCVQSQSTATEASFRVTIPTGYTVSTTASDHDVSTAVTTGWPSGALAWPGVGTEATNVTGQVITVASSDLDEAELYCVNFTNATAITTHATPSDNYTGTVATYDSSPTLIDSGGYSTAVISDDTIDVTATVPQSFSFTIDNTSDALGTQSLGSVGESATPRVVGIDTNAQNGWFVWAREDATNAGMYSALANYSIDSASPGVATSLSAGTEGYITGLSDTNNAGSGTISLGAFDYDDGANDGAPLDNALRIVASSDGPNDADLTVINQLAISSTTPAATDYQDFITFVGAGNF